MARETQDSCLHLPAAGDPATDPPASVAGTSLTVLSPGVAATV